MKLSRDTYKGLNCWVLENEALRVTVVPDLGAKIASIHYKPQDFEVLAQPSAGIFRQAKYGADFGEYDTSGADEMFPTIDPCHYQACNGSPISLPDHGELWSVPWRSEATPLGLFAETAGRALAYRFSRSLTLQERVIACEYQVTNTGQIHLPVLWAFHGLVACDEATRLILPTERVMNVHASPRLGRVGELHPFPQSSDPAGRPLRLDRISSSMVRNTEKYYAAGRLAKGEASLTLNRNRLLYRLRFPVEQVPYLGVWINEGGYKNEYNCALEPSTAYYDSPATAMRLGTLPLLDPGASLAWRLDIELTPIRRQEDRGVRLAQHTGSGRN